MLPPKHCNINLTGPIPRWDEAIPLGNGILGSLFWGPMEHLRISVDIAGLWLRRRPEEKLDKEFGNFQHQLADYPAHTLHETIPHFHDTPKRFVDFQRAVAEDRMGRAAQVQREIEFVRAREAEYHVMVDLLAAGKLPLRVTHNDTKLNNILFDKTTGEGLCVIDLDTVMPGLAANDFGDSIRFGANHCAEDEADLSKVNFSMELFEIYTKGFLQAAGETFTPLEKQTLPWGAKLMTMECGMRFLADYLEGDHYFHINYEPQNLNRARTQFKLTADMERNWDAMQKVIEKYC